MRKKIALNLYILLAIGLTIVGIYSIPFTQSEQKNKFAPTELGHDESKVDRKAMRRWIADMHRAAPGVDYKKMDAETRMQRRFSGRMQMDSLAGGKIEGEWIERGCNVQSGRIVAVEYDQSNGDLYCFSAGGTLWKGNMNGTSWQPLNDQQSVPSPSKIKIVQNGSSRRFLGGTESKWFMFSDDEGHSWSTAQGLSNVANWGYIRKTIVKNDADNTIYLLTWEWDYTNWLAVTCIYKSVNKGSSFVQIANFPENTFGDVESFDLWSHPTLDNELFMLHEDSLYIITPGDSVYHQGTIQTTETGTALLTGTVINGTTYLYAYINKKIFRSNNGGVSWVQKSDVPETPFNQNSFNCSLTDSNAVFFGGVDCYRSWDGGDYWPRVNYWYDYYPNPQNKLHADIPAIYTIMVNGQETQIVCTDASLYKSTNKLYTVQNLGMTGLNASRLYDSYSRRSDPTMVYVGTQDQGYQRTDIYSPGLITFEQVISGDYGHIVSSDGGENIWMVYPGFAAFWEDAAYSFTNLTTWDFDDSEHFWIPPLMADPDNPYACYMAGGRLTGSSGSFMIKLTYSGAIQATQMSFNFSSLGGGNISAMAYSPIDNNHWYVLTDEGYFYHSSNKGQNWTRHTTAGPGAHYFYGATIHPSASQLGTVYIGGSGYSNPAVFRSTNHGVNFQAIQSGLPNTMVYELSGDENDSLIFAATEVGPFCYVVSDNAWYDLTALGAPDQTYWTVDYVESIKTARFGTYGRGMWDFKLQQSGIGLDEDAKDGFVLYPNPASSYVIVDNAMNQDAEIYDLRSRLVWKGKLQSNKEKIDVSNLADGSYLLVLNGERRKAKMLVIQR